MRQLFAPPPSDGIKLMLWPDTAAAKIAVFKECGIEVAVTPSDMADALLRAAKTKGAKLA
jgi:hypothetical protein